MKNNGWKMMKNFYDKYQKNVEKESGVFINKFIKDFFDWQNKYIERNKAAIKKYLRTPEDKYLHGGMRY